MDTQYKKKQTDYQDTKLGQGESGEFFCMQLKLSSILNKWL